MCKNSKTSQLRVLREILFKIIFANLFIEQSAKFQYELYKVYALSESFWQEADKRLQNVLENMEELTEILSKYCIRNRVDRIFLVDKAFLLLAIAEMKYCENIPHVVTIHEVVTIAKKYSTEKSLSFINGVLAAYLKDIEIDNQMTDIDLENYITNFVASYEEGLKE